MKRASLLSIAIACCLLADLEARTWTSLDGKTLEGEFVSSDGTSVSIKRSDGRTFTLALDRFSQADRAFVSEKLRQDGAAEKGKASAVTGEIRDPEDGDMVEREFAVKGRTRGAPDGFVAMVFLLDKKTEAFFPYGEPAKANRSFTIYINHLPTDQPEWEAHLYVLPEAAAKELAAWHAKAAKLVMAGRKDEIEAYDAKLTDEAIPTASVKYYLETD